MLHRNLSSILNLLRGTAHHLRQTGSSHRGGATHLALATHLSTRNRRTLLIQHTHSRRRQEEINNSLITSSLTAMANTLRVIHRVMQHRRNNTRSTIRRSSHHATTKSILLIDRQSNQVHPVNSELRRLRRILHHQIAVPRTRTATHLQRTRQITHTRQRRTNAFLHHTVDMQDAVTDLLLRTQRTLIRHLQLRNRQARLIRHLQ